MDNRNINDAVAKQQYTMTAINNLAVLLNESLERMNEQMSSCMLSKGGKKSCKNPSGKGGKMSVKGMKGLQNQIGQQLQKLKEGMDAKNGKSGRNKAENYSLNKEIARLAAQQEALRNEINRYQDEIGSKGMKEQSSINEVVKEMEKIERDLINKKVTQETMRRQQEIMTRLLESEKAEQIREQEEKREATESKNQKISNPEPNFKYNIKGKSSFDNIQLALPVLSSFYKSKVNSYIVKIGN
jgi:chromosome segregation ATPase